MLKCPECGKERPYRTKRTKIDNGIPKIRLAYGIRGHYDKAHPNSVLTDSTIEQIICSQKAVDVDPALINGIEKSENWIKWSYYNLFKKD
ncbi:MAG: hypothetical protein U9O96_07055 [Candidatus Thermoplasmatota archaeon]|nr:hypothetical protein [Candidatus Thermoplasmatota archaeon]